jgi:hypothetical protein
MRPDTSQRCRNRFGAPARARRDPGRRRCGCRPGQPIRRKAAREPCASPGGTASFCEHGPRPRSPRARAHRAGGRVRPPRPGRPRRSPRGRCSRLDAEPARRARRARRRSRGAAARPAARPRVGTSLTAAASRARGQASDGGGAWWTRRGQASTLIPDPCVPGREGHRDGRRDEAVRGAHQARRPR